MKASIMYTENGHLRGRPANAGDWGSVEAHICGRRVPGCVQTTEEASSMDWDLALGRDLTPEDTSVT